MNIRNTVTDYLTRQGGQQYLSVAEPIITVLEGREATIKNALRTFATQNGLSNSQVDNLFVQCGLDEAPQVLAQSASPFPQGVATPAPNTQGDEADVMERLRQAEESIRRLTQVAQQAGLQV